MGVGNYSVEASIIESGKTVKGILTLFIDEYTFGSTRRSVNWENVTCEQSTVKVKVFLRTVNKPSIVFFYGGERSSQYVLEPEQIDSLLNKVKEFAEIVKNAMTAAIAIIFQMSLFAISIYGAVGTAVDHTPMTAPD